MNTRSFLKALRQIHEDEAGQAFSEYFLVILVCVIAVSSSFRVFNSVLGPYYTAIVRWVTLPIP